MPSFSGAYKSEFEQAWNESESDFVHEVIADQEITDEEWAEVATRISKCVESKGMTFKGFLDDGGYEVDTGSLSGDEANALLPACEDESGETWLNHLRRQLASNPDNTPAEERVVQCLIRNSVVAGDYTAEDYLKDAPQQSFPYLEPDTGIDGLRACSANPDVDLSTQ
ncbi:hypothetical protein DY023_06260 [Microbacterium bovistercoris]|uniref:Uncharacterized protein n=2 Tax=Microbacterium bovistercoris TaxID=2293570 RepID=A0A371NV24_9MICO|nr:hypothetical protein DY023_06260 [Microbacterium bovistercoris]